MPKVKTHKGLKKRFKITARGNVVHMQAGKSHLMSDKTGKKVRQLRRPAVLNPTQAKLVKRLLPYE
jgi:large subunit ribosomal protein L35